MKKITKIMLTCTLLCGMTTGMLECKRSFLKNLARHPFAENIGLFGIAKGLKYGARGITYCLKPLAQQAHKLAPLATTLSQYTPKLLSMPVKSFGRFMGSHIGTTFGVLGTTLSAVVGAAIIFNTVYPLIKSAGLPNDNYNGGLLNMVIRGIFKSINKPKK